MKRIAGLTLVILVNGGSIFGAPSDKGEISIDSQEDLVIPINAQKRTSVVNVPADIALMENSIQKAVVLHFEILNHIQYSYYEKLDIFKCSEKIEQRGVSYCTDPYSYYLNPEEVQEEKIHSSGELGGIGTTLNMKSSDDGPTITHIVKDSPAEKVGLKSGDMIVAIATDTANLNWIYLKGFSVHEAAKYIRGEPGTNIQLKIIREQKAEEELIFKVTRATVRIEYLSYKKIGSVGYVKIHAFFGKDLHNEFYKTLKYFSKENIFAVIIDLRNNGGGYLHSVVMMVNYFKNGTVVYQKRWNNEPEPYDRFSGVNFSRLGKFKNFKVVILQNEYSASASEIFSCYLKEDFGAAVVGQTSFGKGIVQSLIPLSNGGELHLTISEYLVGEKQKKVHGEGVKPTIEVANPKEVKIETDDLQLKRALEEAKKLLKE